MRGCDSRERRVETAETKRAKQSMSRGISRLRPVGRCGRRRSAPKSRRRAGAHDGGVSDTLVMETPTRERMRQNERANFSSIPSHFAGFLLRFDMLKLTLPAKTCGAKRGRRGARHWFALSSARQSSRKFPAKFPRRDDRGSGRPGDHVSRRRCPTRSASRTNSPPSFSSAIGILVGAHPQALEAREAGTTD